LGRESGVLGADKSRDSQDLEGMVASELGETMGNPQEDIKMVGDYQNPQYKPRIPLKFKLHRGWVKFCGSKANY
jgi:hypothetical protein